MSRPLVFISHKHSDRAIANVVRSFITEQTRSTVEVFQSSDPTAVNPQVGRTLNADLRKALWHAGAVILIYTSPDQDWGYCMWECGVATLPDSPDTRIILFQCGDTSPSLFDGQLGVNARNKISLQTFVTQFMTQPGFLPRVSDALTGYHASAQEVQQATNKFFDDLQAVLPEGVDAEWPAHPFVQLQLPIASAKLIGDPSRADGRGNVAATVLADTIVSDSDKYFQALFGVAAFEGRVTLKTLLDKWRSAFPNGSEAWFDALTNQVAQASQWQFPPLRWTAMSAVSDGRPYAPVVTRVRKLPAINSLQFDVYFYPFSLMSATPVLNRMVNRDDMMCKVVTAGAEDTVNVVELLTELDEKQFNRIPFLDPAGCLIYIAHRSMLDQFVSRRLRRGGGTDVHTATLATVFDEAPYFKEMFRDTAAFVSCSANLVDAKRAMESVKGCYDVFVTESGDRREAVLGWLTDVIIAASEPADN